MQDKTSKKQISMKANNSVDASVEEFTQIRRKPSESLKNLFDVLESLIYAIIAVLIIFTFFARLTVVDGSSMDTTLKHGEYLVVANVFFTYEPDNGDIVVVNGDFENYYNEKYKGLNHYMNYNYSAPIVKRVIATEGQSIVINYNTLEVFVDGELLDESYANYFNEYRTPITLGEYRYDENGEVIRDSYGNAIYYPYFNKTTGIFSATVPEGCVFVMGDNRDNSADSRLNEIGFVPEEFIVGKAVFRLAPLNKMGGL